MKHLLMTASIAAGLCFAGCTAQTPAPQFTKAEVQALKTAAIKSEIMQLVYDYAIARDNIDAEAYGNVFAPDGRFVFGGGVYIGPEAIGGRIKDAPKDGASLHMIGASQINIESETSATGLHYGGVYGAKFADAETEGGPMPVDGPMTMGIYSDQYRLTDKGWKISERSFQRLFVPSQ